MSELTAAKNRQTSLRCNLLVNVSIIALLGYGGAAKADPGDADRPIVWVELGGQFERMDGGQPAFIPSFAAHAPPIDAAVISDAQKPPGFSIGGESKISFQPEASDWVFSASVRYGRSNGGNHLHHQTSLPPEKRILGTHVKYFTPSRNIFADGQTDLRESHAVIDFQAGKDVGLGMFGGSSVVSAGVRFAQFNSTSQVTLHARPVYGFVPYITPNKYLGEAFRHTYTAVARIKRSVHAIGPSLSWDASARLLGDKKDMEFTFDWGLNAAILFGRQHVAIHHQTTGYFYHRTGGLFNGHAFTSRYVHPNVRNSSRAVTVPNAGGFAGVSFRYAAAKVSLGYRADFFFGAMDGGIDTAKKENRGFYGPFATISIGIGG